MEEMSRGHQGEGVAFQVPEDIWQHSPGHDAGSTEHAYTEAAQLTHVVVAKAALATLAHIRALLRTCSHLTPGFCNELFKQFY